MSMYLHLQNRNSGAQVLHAVFLAEHQLLCISCYMPVKLMCCCSTLWEHYGFTVGYSKTWTTISDTLCFNIVQLKSGTSVKRY